MRNRKPRAVSSAACSALEHCRGAGAPLPVGCRSGGRFGPVLRFFPPAAWKAVPFGLPDGRAFCDSGAGLLWRVGAVSMQWRPPAAPRRGGCPGGMPVLFPALSPFSANFSAAVGRGMGNFPCDFASAVLFAKKIKKICKISLFNRAEMGYNNC